ncbi:MAG: hypothetical protein ACSLE0_08080 [Chitinophagaceae bacterium]
MKILFYTILVFLAAESFQLDMFINDRSQKAEKIYNAGEKDKNETDDLTKKFDKFCNQSYLKENKDILPGQENIYLFVSGTTRGFYLLPYLPPEF